MCGGDEPRPAIVAEGAPLPPRHSVPGAVAVPDRQVAFTMPPHSGPWLTGASRRRWLMFSQAVPERDPYHADETKAWGEVLEVLCVTEPASAEVESSSVTMGIRRAIALT